MQSHLASGEELLALLAYRTGGDTQFPRHRFQVLAAQGPYFRFLFPLRRETATGSLLLAHLEHSFQGPHGLSKVSMKTLGRAIYTPPRRAFH